MLLISQRKEYVNFEGLSSIRSDGLQVFEAYAVVHILGLLFQELQQSERLRNSMLLTYDFDISCFHLLKAPGNMFLYVL